MPLKPTTVRTACCATATAALERQCRIDAIARGSLVDSLRKRRGIGAGGSLISARAKSICMADFAHDRTRSNGRLRFRLPPIHVLKVAATHLFLQVAVAIALALVPAVAIGQTPPIPSPPVSAGIPENVRVQPHGPTFTPNSAEYDAVQRRLSISNAMQAAQDAAFDRRLTICRRC
jgi:hypothetical protein